MKTWLSVPFADRRAASAARAKWDDVRKSWYADGQTDLSALQRYIIKPDQAFPSEDRSYEQKRGLFVDLVPSTSWFTNVRSHVAKADWDSLRHIVYGRADYSCEVCHATLDRSAPVWGPRGEGIAAKTPRLDAHERWSYNEDLGIQRLERLICLCQACHTCTHWGYSTGVLGLTDQVKRHLKSVTGMNEDAYQAHVAEAFEIWRQRSDIDWMVDLSVVAEAGYTIQHEHQQSR